MDFTNEITLDLNAVSNYPIISAKQNDIESRILLVHFTKNGVQYKMNKNNSVSLRLRKPDGKLILNKGKINTDGTATITLTQQCLTVAGRAYADLMEINGKGQLLSTTAFIINIQASPDVMGQEALSSNEFSYLMSFLGEAQGKIEEAEAWAIGMEGDQSVPSDHEAYNNNAKYWSQQAENNFIKTQNIAASLNFNFNQTTGKLKITYQTE